MLLENVLHHQFYHILSIIFFLRIPSLVFKFDNALEGSIQYQKKTTINLPNKIMMGKSVILHFSVYTNILDILKSPSLFS